jgi:hypothetical protein
MSNGYKSQQVDLTSVGDLLELMKFLKEGDANVAKNQFSTATHLNNNIKNASTIEELNNLIPSIDQHNSKVATSGNDEYILDYSDKKTVFQQLPMAYEQLEDIYEGYAKNPEKLTAKLLQGGWEGFTERERNLINLKEIVARGKAYGYRYKGDGTYSQTLLEKALDDRINANTAAFEALDTYQGDFNLINPDGTVDEESKMLLEMLKLNIVTGDVNEVQKTINTMTTRSIQGYKTYSKAYAKYSEMIMKHPNSVKKNAEELGASDDADVMAMLSMNGYDANSEIPLEHLIDMKNLFLENAKSFNIQHRVATGILYDENPIWEATTIDPNNISGYETTEVLDGLSNREKFELKKKQLSGDTEGEAGDITPTQEESMDVTPAKEEPIMTEKELTPASPEYKQKMYKERKEEEKKSKINYINQIMPEVELKNTERKGKTLTTGQVIAGITDIDKETLHKDVEKIINIVGGVVPMEYGKPIRKKRFPLDSPPKEVIDNRSELEKLIPSSLEEGFLGLQRIIDKYNKDFKAYEKRLEQWEKAKAQAEAKGRPFFTGKPTPSDKLAIKILTRYNTIREKMLKIQSK